MLIGWRATKGVRFMRRAVHIVLAAALFGGTGAFMVPWGTTGLPQHGGTATFTENAPIRAAAIRRDMMRATPVRHIAVHRAVRRARTRVRRRPVVHTVRVPVPSSAASELASMINQARRAHGFGALRWSGALASGARSHSASMAASGSLYHSTTSQMWSDADRACTCSRVGEMVGESRSITRVFNAFMASSVHRAEILNGRFRYVGVGVVRSGATYWVTVRFAG
ncbi:MAG: CAP domain-containing protein [Actinomycetota bacterium]